MRKPKHGPSLFDLLEEADGSTALGLSGSGRRREVQTEANGRKDEPPAIVTVPAAAARTNASAGEQARGAARLIEVDGGHVRVSLTSATGAAVIFAGAVVVVAVYVWGYHRGERTGLRSGYEAGRSSYAAAAINEIELARRGPPETSLVGGLLEEVRDSESPEEGALGTATSVGRGPEAGQPFQWIRNYTYVVAQEFSAGNAEHVGDAQAFLAAGGVETAAVGLGGGGVQLITLQGYDCSDPTQKRMADQLLQRVRAIGVRYYASGGGYKLEGYLKTLKRDSW